MKKIPLPTVELILDEKSAQRKLGLIGKNGEHFNDLKASKLAENGAKYRTEIWLDLGRLPWGYTLDQLLEHFKVPFLGCKKIQGGWHAKHDALKFYDVFSAEYRALEEFVNNYQKAIDFNNVNVQLIELANCIEVNIFFFDRAKGHNVEQRGLISWSKNRKNALNVARNFVKRYNQLSGYLPE